MPEVTAIAFGCARICVATVPAEVGILTFRGHAGDHHAGGDGDQQRRNLRDQAVADGQDGVRLDRLHRLPCRACTTPMISPPTMLMTVMMMPAMASPLTNFMAPSIAP